ASGACLRLLDDIDCVAVFKAGGDLHVVVVVHARFHIDALHLAGLAFHQHIGAVGLVEAEGLLVEDDRVHGLLLGYGHGGLHAGEHIVGDRHRRGDGVVGRAAGGGRDAVYVGKFGIEGEVQRGDVHRAGLADVDAGDVIFVHAHGDGQVVEVHHLDQRRPGGHLVALLHGDAVDAAVEAGLERLSTGEAHQPVAGLDFLFLGNVDLAHRARRGSGERFAVLHVDIAGKAHGVGDGTGGGGIAAISGGGRGLQAGPYEQAHRAR